MANIISSNAGKRSYKLKFICIILMLLAGFDWKFVDAGMTEGLTEGIKYAGQMFGINTAADVADLVAKAFSNAATNTAQKKPDLLSTLFQWGQKPTASYNSEEDDSQSVLHNKNGENQQKGHSNENLKDDTPSPPSPPAQPNLPFKLSSAKIISSVLRMIGFDARKLGALALNALVMMAQAIGNTLLGAFSKRTPNASTVDGGNFFKNENSASATESAEESSHDDNEYRPRQLRSGSPVDWYLENPTDDMKIMLSKAMSPQLAEDLVDMIVDVENTIPNGKTRAACVKMFVCKCSPFIWGMQKSLEKRVKGINNQEDEKDDKGRENQILNKSILYKHLPSLEEFRKHSAVCEQRYKDHCIPYDIVKKK